MLFREIIAVYSQNQMWNINRKCRLTDYQSRYDIPLLNWVAPEPGGSSVRSPGHANDPHPKQSESTPHTSNQSPPRYLLIPSSHLRLGLPSGLFPSGFPTKTLPSPTRATWPTHLILLDQICLIISGAEYILWSSPLCNFLHSPVTSPLFQIFSSAPCSQTPRPGLRLYCRPRNKSVDLQWGGVSSLPNPQAGGASVTTGLKI
jgi:hypothetical protein